MKILLVNQNWFAPELREMGHEVHSLGTLWDLDSRVRLPLMHIDDVIKELPGGFTPDRIVVLDNSAPITIVGLEECPIPSVFLSVDTHHHATQHRYLWHLFDHQFVAQRDYMDCFEAVGATPEWMPLWASRQVTPQVEKKYGAVFVGTLNAKLNPERVKFFKQLAELAPIKVTEGDWGPIFARSALVVNQTVKGDLNFRVFESMISGAALLTERSGNGLSELFKDGEQVVLYKKGDVQEAAAKIRQLTEDTALCKRIAEAGRSEVLRAHLPIHRAQRLEAVLKSLKRVKRPLRHFAAMSNYAELARRSMPIDGAMFLKSLALALKAATAGLEDKEPLTQELGCLALVLGLKYDQAVGSNAGRDLIAKLSEQYPTILALKMAHLRNMLNTGRHAEARLVAKAFTETPEALFARVDDMVIALSREVWGEGELSPG